MGSKLSMGHTALICRRCKKPAFLDNLSLEVMTEYRCPTCGNKMTDHEFIELKAKYYALLLETFNENCGGVWRSFDYDICVDPHIENRKIPEE